MISFTVTFTILGVVSIFFGEQILEWTEQYKGLFHSFLAVLFLLIGFYVLGLRSHHILRMFPFRDVSFYAKSTKSKLKKSRSPLMKAYSLGALFCITPSPCTTPMIIAMLPLLQLPGLSLKAPSY